MGLWDFFAPLGVTSPACLPVQHGHRDPPLAWRSSEGEFPPPSPASRTCDGGALSAFQKVAPDAVPFGPGLPQGHGGWNQGAGARSNHPLGAVAGVRPLWAGGSGQGSPWDILGAMPACPGPMYSITQYSTAQYSTDSTASQRQLRNKRHHDRRCCYFAARAKSQYMYSTGIQ